MNHNFSYFLILESTCDKKTITSSSNMFTFSFKLHFCLFAAFVIDSSNWFPNFQLDLTLHLISLYYYFLFNFRSFSSKISQLIYCFFNFPVKIGWAYCFMAFILSLFCLLYFVFNSRFKTELVYVLKMFCIVLQCLPIFIF